MAATHGRHAIALIKQILGIEAPGIREIHIDARYDDIAVFTVEGLCKPVSQVDVRADDSNEVAFTKRYTVTVTPIQEHD